MTSDHYEQTGRSKDSARSFPWRCPNCRQKEVYLSSHPHEAEVRHDGRLYKLSIPALRAPTCRACGEVLFDHNADEQVNEWPLKWRLGLPFHLMTFVAKLRRLGLRQRHLAKELGIAEETLSRWLSGVQIQSKAMNNLMRMYFEKQNRASPAAVNVWEHTSSALVQQWQAMFPSVGDMQEVIEYSRSVAARRQLIPFGAV